MIVMKKIFIILIVVLLPGKMLWGVTFRYVNTTVDEEISVQQSYWEEVIEVHHETPKSLLIFGRNCLLDTPTYSLLTGPECWEEHYLLKRTYKVQIQANRVTRQVKELGSVTLYKSCNDGLTQIKVYDQASNRVYLFRPVDGEKLPVLRIPSIFINLVKFANVKEDGTIVNDYGSLCENTDYLNTRVEYQTVAPCKEIRLDIRIVNMEGRLLRDKKSPKGYTFSVSMHTAVESAMPITQEIGVWKSKRLTKGSRMEIYADRDKLCSIEIPVRGTIMYKPIYVERMNGGESLPFMPGSGSILARIRPSLLFEIRGNMYRMMTWEEVEM